MYTGFWWGHLRVRIARRRWEDEMKMDLQDVEYGGMEWVEVAQDRGCCECGGETFRFRTVPGISWLAAELSDSQEELCVMTSHSVGCSISRD